MILFSKRNIKKTSFSRRRFLYRREIYRPVTDNKREKEDLRNLFLSTQLRSRLQEEIRYSISTGNYIEKFLVVTLPDNTFTLHQPSLMDLSKRELGYDITEILETRKGISFLNESDKYDDAHFFDFIELLLVFSKNESREEFKSRLREIYDEEDDDWVINGCMLVDKSDPGIRTLIPIIRDERLKELLSSIYDNIVDGDYKILANTTADALQYIFSASKKEATKTYTNQMIDDIARKWTTTEGMAELCELINDEVKLAKSFNNKISELRHSDKHTIPVESKSLYKLIMYKNLSLIELAIQSSPEKYILDENPNTIRDKYISKYNLHDHKGWIIKDNTKDPFDDDDIPF